MFIQIKKSCFKNRKLFDILIILIHFSLPISVENLKINHLNTMVVAKTCNLVVTGESRMGFWQVKHPYQESHEYLLKQLIENLSSQGLSLFASIQNSSYVDNSITQTSVKNSKWHLFNTLAAQGGNNQKQEEDNQKIIKE